MKKCKSLQKKAVNKNTVKPNETSWAESRGANNDIFKYETKQLEESLSRFFGETCESDGFEYELVKSLNSPFFLPHIQAQPGRRKKSPG